MRLVGYSDLQARSAYQPVIHLQNGRSIAYVGHHGGTAINPLTGAMESNGTSIVDVTDPSAPRALFHIPGEKGQGESGGAQMVRLCNGRDLPRGDPAKTYLLRTYGNSAHQIWDVSAPERPALVVTVVAGLKDTHKSWWECDTGIAFLVSGLPDWRTRRMTQIFDLSDPARPVHIRDFGLPGQQPGAAGTAPTELHGPISTGRGGNRVYFGYGTNRGGIVQIVDRDKLLNGPKAPTAANLAYPQVGRLELSPLVGAHTTFPLLKVEVPEFARDEHGRVRDFLVIVNESLRNECREEARQMVYFVDITAESRPFPVANYNVPEAGGGFCSRGGRFGAHSSNENFTPVFYRRIMFFAWFNAGVRAVDVRDPFTRARSVITFRRLRTRPTSAASRPAARIAARSRSRPTTWRSTTGDTSTSWIAQIPACTSLNSPARRVASRIFRARRALCAVTRRSRHAIHGLNVTTPVRSKSRTLRVTTVIPCTNAVAAINASRSDRGSGTCSRAQRWATTVSTGSMRPSNCNNTCSSIHARKAAPCFASFRAVCNAPSSSSSTVIAERKRLATAVLRAHAKTFGFALPGRRSSETTLVSITNIKQDQPA